MRPWPWCGFPNPDPKVTWLSPPTRQQQPQLQTTIGGITGDTNKILTVIVLTKYLDTDNYLKVIMGGTDKKMTKYLQLRVIILTKYLDTEIILKGTYIILRGTD
jgi:hypothetical protein